MSETLGQDLSGVSETLLLTLCLRAMESQRPDALIKDEKAEALAKKISDDGLYDFGRMRPLHLSEANKLVIILRNREFDRSARDFLARQPDEWGFFDDPTPRLAHIRWLRPIEALARTLRIYHFQLGKAVG